MAFEKEGLPGKVTAMTKVLLISFGSRGDVQPYIALGKALSARGASVTLSTSKTFNEIIQSHGLAAAPNSIDVQEMMQSPEMEQALRSFRGKLQAMRIGKELVSRQLDESWQIVRELRPDIIVYHPKAAAATYFARAVGATAIPSFLQPGIIPTKHLPPVLVTFPDLGQFGNRVSNAIFGQILQLGGRSIVGPWMKAHPKLMLAGEISPLDGYCPRGTEVPRLHAFSRHIVPKPEDWPSRDLLTGAWFLDESVNQPDPALANFVKSGPPPIYVGFGSMRGKNPKKTTRIVIDAIRLSGTRAVLALGWGGLLNADVPEGIHIVKSAPHDWLFPRCAAVVHHGGAGTLHQGLRCGRPTLICPVFADQPFWGKRVEALGVGPKPIKMKKLTTPNLARALDELRQPQYHAAAVTLAEAIHAEGGATHAAEAVL